jgi:serine/threonine protein kinase
MEQVALSESHRAYPGSGLPPAELPPGLEVNGFKLVRYVDTGSYGCVWQAESVHQPGQYYALKFSLVPPGNSATADARAVREVQLLLQAAHPHVVRVVAHGRWKNPEVGLHYTVLEWVEGATLEDWARKHNPTVRALVHLAQKVVRAVQAGHERGVLHRDLKPANILVREADGEPRVADYSVGEATDSPTLTLGSLSPGTPEYLSPEALAYSRRGGGVPYRFQPADDWYAVGVLLYALLTEVLPFGDRADVNFMQRVARCRPVPPHRLNPRIPLALSRVVMRLLEKKPRRRYRDGHALWAALDTALKEKGDWDTQVYTPPPPHAPGQTPTHPPSTADGWVAEDLETLLKHDRKQDIGHEARRRAAAESLRNALLPSRPRAWPPAVRRGLATVGVLLAVVSLWATWAARWSTPLSPTPDAAPNIAPPTSPRPLPAVPVSLDSLLPLEPRPLTPMAALPQQLTLATPTAITQKEAPPVKTPQNPDSRSPASAPRGKRASSASRTGALCVLGSLTVACPGIPVRPAPTECPAAAINSMTALRIPPGEKAQVRLHAEGGENPVTFRVGPLVSRIERPDDTNVPEGTLLFGEVIAGGGERFFIRYREAQFPGATERVPVCGVAVDPFGGGEPGLLKETGTTDEVFTYPRNFGPVRFVLKFAE